MATTTIGGISASVTTPADIDFLEVEQGGVSKKLAHSVLKTYMTAAISSGLSNTNSSVSAISSGLSGALISVTTSFNTTNSSVSAVSSGLSLITSSVSSVSSGLSSVSSGLSFSNSSVSAISSSLSTVRSSVSAISSGLSTTNAGLGSMSSQNANGVAITGGDLSNIGSVSISKATSTPGTLLSVSETFNRSSTVADIPQAMNLTFNDTSTAGRTSAQIFRFVYTRSAGATGLPTSFDSMLNMTAVCNEDFNSQLRLINVENVTVASGKTVNRVVGMWIQNPTGSGTVTTKQAIITSPGAGNCLFSTTTDNGVDVAQFGGSISATSIKASAPLKLGSYTLSTLPSASAFTGYLIRVSDATGGPKTCESDGTNWKILNTTTTVV